MKRVIRGSTQRSKDEPIKSVKSSKDATFKTDNRLSPTSERYKGYLIVLDRGGDGYNVYDKHRELEDAGYPSRKAAKEFIDSLITENDQFISSASRVSAADKDAVSYGNESNDEDYNPYSFMEGDQLEWSGLHGGQYKGVVTDVNDEYITVDVMWTAEDTGDTVIDTQKFEIATDPEGKECIIVWTYGPDAGYVYPPSGEEYVNSASYGGAFDIEDDQYFTKDEIVEFGNTVCDHLNETFYDTYDVSDVYMETPKRLVLTVVQKSDESEFTATVDIDMRKIRKPADLMDRYLGEVVYALQQDIQSYNKDINAATLVGRKVRGRNSYGDAVGPVGTVVKEYPSGKDRYGNTPIDIQYEDGKIKKSKSFWVSFVYDVKTATDITSAQKTGLDAIKTKIWNAASAKMEDMGFPLDEIPDYLFVEVKQEDGRIRVEVRAELTYNGLTKLINELDPIVQQFDKDSYFEPVEPGIAEAYIWNISNINSSKYIGAGMYDIPEPSLIPPDSEWERADMDDELIEIRVDAVLNVLGDGFWNFEDSSTPWAACPYNSDGKWYTDEDVYIGDKIKISECVDELIVPYIPDEEGDYHITCDVFLKFSIDNVQVKTEHYRGYDDYVLTDNEYYSDNADVTFLQEDSHIKNLEITKIH